MAVTKYLDKTGLTYFWNKIKAWCNNLFALDSAVVHKTDNETINGEKTFNDAVLLKKGSTLVDGTSTIQLQGIIGNNDGWQIRSGATANDAGFLEIATYDNGNEPIYFRQRTSSTITRTLTLLDASGNSAFPGTITATTPATSDNSTTVATTAFVKAQGYLTSHQSLDNYVTLNGVQTISGTKTFTAYPTISMTQPAIVISNSNLIKGTNPSSTAYANIFFQDKTTGFNTLKRIGSLDAGVTTAGQTELSMRAFDWGQETNTNGAISIYYPKGGTPYTAAPTPATADNSTKIATTAFVKAQGYLTSVSGTAGTSLLAWNTENTVYTIGGHAIKVKLPANPNTNTTYTFATGDSNGQIKVTPSGGSAQNVSVKGLGSAAYTESSAYAAASHTHNKLVSAGDNVASTSTNTYAAGHFNVRWFSQTDKVPGQPSQYGFLATFATGDNASEVHQIWCTQANGDLYHRGTNGSSYTSPPAFKKIIDSSNETQLSLTTSGSGNAITALSVSNHAITVTKESTFSLSNHTHSYLPLTGGTLTGSLTGTAFLYKSTSIDRADTTTDSSVENWVYGYKDKNNNDIGNYGINRYPKTGQNRHRFRLRNTGGSWADLIFEFKDNGQYFLWMTGSSGTTNGGFSGNVTGSSSSCTGNSATASKVTGGISASHVGGCVYGNALVNSNITSYGAIWNAATKDTRVSMATYPGSNNLVYLLSCTNANVSSNTNTIYHYVTWDAGNGALTNYGQVIIDRVGSSAGGSLRIKGDAINYAISLQDTGVTKGTALGGTRYLGIDFYGNTYSDYKNRFAVIENQVTGTTSKLMMAAYNSTTATNTGICAISVRVDASGNGFAEAPTPASDANDTRIATTKWVKDRLGSYAALSGATFTGKVVMQGYLRSTRADPCVELDVSGYTKGANLSARTNAGVYIHDKSADSEEPSRLACMYSHVNTDKSIEIGLAAYKNVASNTDNQKIAVYCATDGTGYAVCPTPAAASNDTKIATTAWVRTFCDTTQKYMKAVSVTGSGNAITAASLSNGTLTLTKGTTFLTSHASLSKTDSGSGNAVTAISVSGHEITVTKGSTFSLSTHTHSYLPLSGGNMTGNIVYNSTDTLGIRKGNATSMLEIAGGSALNKGARLALYGESHASYAGRFDLIAANASTSRSLVGTVDSLKWNNAAIQTSSDARLKTSLNKVSDEILDVWEEVEWGEFQYLDAKEKYGDDARLHLGIVAQSVDNTFYDHNLDACRYGILCYDMDDDMWTVRYAEALAMEAAYQRRKNKILENRISELEKQVSDMIILLQNLTNSNG